MGDHPIEKDVERVLRSHSNIGLLLSGGLDSAALGYLLVTGRNALKTSNVFEFIVLPTSDAALKHALTVAAWLDGIGGVPSKIRVKGNPNLHHALRVRSALHEALKDLPHLSLVLNAANATPEELSGGPIRVNSSNPRVHLPFFSYTKDKLVALYLTFKTDELFRITHTCTETRGLRCGICWQCRERAWAFNKCGYKDPGTL